MKNLCLKIFLVIVVSFNATFLYSAEITTTVKTTSIISQDQINEATLGQLAQAIKSFNGKTVNFRGSLTNYMDHYYELTTNEGVLIKLLLDDGRTVYKKAERCTTSSPCKVTMDVDIQMGFDFDLCIMDDLCIGGIGYNVNFND